ncbi:MAG: guanylate kinase [Clostridia bacterium]|nr:guanylate kinase [Clostridia bacterium]
MNNDGMLVVLSGPSGSGKDTVLSEVYKTSDDLVQSISMTTRSPRDGEVDGVDYYFVSEEYFLNAIDDGRMLEYAKYGTNYYGTPKEPVDNWLRSGKTVILKIEVQGAENIKKLYSDCVSIFITPPSLSVLEKRLRLRGTEQEEDIVRRLNTACDELQKIKYYDYVVINDALVNAVEEVKSIILAEKLKVSRRKNIISEVTKNV